MKYTNEFTFFFYPGFNLQYKGLNQYSVVVTSSPCLALINSNSLIYPLLSRFLKKCTCSYQSDLLWKIFFIIWINKKRILLVHTSSITNKTLGLKPDRFCFCCRQFILSHEYWVLDKFFGQWFHPCKISFENCEVHPIPLFNKLHNCLQCQPLLWHLSLPFLLLWLLTLSCTFCSSVSVWRSVGRKRIIILIHLCFHSKREQKDRKRGGLCKN